MGWVRRRDRGRMGGVTGVVNKGEGEGVKSNVKGAWSDWGGGGSK